MFLGAEAEKLLFDPFLLPGLSGTLERMRDDRKVQREYLSSITDNFKANALRHLDALDNRYQVLKGSLAS